MKSITQTMYFFIFFYNNTDIYMEIGNWKL
jgi:hypothetical protein